MQAVLPRLFALCFVGALLTAVPACGLKGKKGAKDGPETPDLALDPNSPLATDVAEARKMLFAFSSVDEYVRANAANRLEAWKEAAEKGQPEGQWLYGQCLEAGVGGEKKPAEAAQWYLKAADQGFAPAQNALGLCYREGLGVKEDDEEAVKLFRKAAEQGDAAAQFNLGEMYEEGDGVKESLKEALEWYRKASKGGYAEASMRLMLAYEEGDGVRKNKAEAEKFRELAVLQIGPNAEKRIADYKAHEHGQPPR